MTNPNYNEQASQAAANIEANQRAALEDPAFAAYLDLADTDQARDPARLHMAFEWTYIRSFDSLNHAIRYLTEISLVENAITELEASGIDRSVVTIDYAAIYRQIAPRYDFVPKDGTIYVFDK
jgi:hypothetical protein